VENDPSSLTGKIVSVFGAARRDATTPTWGSKFADRIEPRAQRVLRVDPKLGTQGYDPKQAIRESDTVLFAVTPDEQINAIAAEHGCEFHEGQVILECSTTKLQIAETLHNLDRRGLSVCSIHPGARADLPSRGQNMLIMEVGSHGAQAKVQAEEMAGILQMNPIEFVSFERHPLAMAITQGVDHAIQRAKIGAQVRLLQLFGFTLEQAEAMAFANTRLGNLATARVAVQDPAVSAKIIAEARALPETRQMLDTLIAKLTEMRDADPKALAQMFADDINALDPDGLWRKKMFPRTGRVLEQMANLEIKGMQIHSVQNEIGTLEAITAVLRRNGINITAITSHNLEPEEGRPGVIFQLGIDEKSIFDLQCLSDDLATIGAKIEQVSK